jgi:predicted lipid-binding transport protein (Tim44 family)
VRGLLVGVAKATARFDKADPQSRFGMLVGGLLGLVLVGAASIVVRFLPEGAQRFFSDNALWFVGGVLFFASLMFVAWRDAGEEWVYSEDGFVSDRDQEQVSNG